ncbi:MAG: hypothetical protein A2293_17160 [Elusimicrobia bacterium RIFOXYB2_FULL_49_7]|nr:MAG: hypothetical protein A2293_17160 [Elusimicrobia bacterium RIFOXYB2_FULL_49_7]
MRIFEIQYCRDPHLALLMNKPEGYFPGETLVGKIPVEGTLTGSIQLHWVDAHNRLVADIPLIFNQAKNAFSFRLHLTSALTVFNRLLCKINNEAVAENEFLITPIDKSWDDFHAVTWASYPLGCAEKLAEYGIDGAVTYSASVRNHNLKQFNTTYIDQVAPKAFSWYHRNAAKMWVYDRQPYIDFLNKKAKTDPYFSLPISSLLTRQHCLSEESTRKLIADRMRQTVDVQRKSAPLFFNIADEIGIADQAAPFDFCFCPTCMNQFRQWLRCKFITLDALNQTWESHFSLWDEVFPMTTHMTIQQNKGRKRKNISSWMYHRAFMEKSMADALSFARDIGRSVDSHGRFGTTGLQAPNAFGGWDFERLCRSVDVMIPYNMGNNFEIIRSLNPDLITMSPYFGNSPVLIRHMWFQLFHGDRAFIFWDNHEKDGALLTLPDKRPTYRAKLLGPHLREMQEGIGRMIIHGRRLEDKIGIHYSQSSIHAHWMLENAALGEAWIRRSSADEFIRNEFRKRRESLVFAIEDTGRQHHFRSYAQLKIQGLLPAREKIFFMSGSVCFSESEALAVEKYVREGGIVVADNLLGLFNEHGVEQKEGRLDKLFGLVRQSGKPSKGNIRLTPHAAGLGIMGKEIAFPASERLKATSRAEVLGKSGSSDCLILHSVGKGKTVYLNFDLQDYRDVRHDATHKAGNDLRKVLEALFILAGIERRVGLEDRNGSHVPGLETVCFANQDEEYVTLGYTHPPRLEEGSLGGEVKRFLLKPYDVSVPVKVTFPKKAHLYDVRKHSYLGFKDAHTFTFKPLEAKIFALLPAKVQCLKIRAPKTIHVGHSCVMEVSLVSEGRTLSGHTLHLDVYSPAGKWIYYYSQNITLNGHTGTLNVPFALNDKKGRWKAVVRDVQSGMTETAFIRLV